MKNIFVFALTITSFLSFSQIRTYNEPAGTIAGESTFLDASANAFTGTTNKAKGLAFPRTDLTTFTFINEGNFFNFPTGYDGMVIYNTGTGISSVGGGVSVTPGFYYFSNTSSSGSTSTGTWKPLGSSESPKIHIIENTATETNLVTANTATEKVISITGTADGITTHMDLGTSVLSEDTVVNFRKAIICDSNGTQVLVAKGSYDSATNKFVTGNGMMNICLPAANDYKVELYFTSN